MDFPLGSVDRCVEVLRIARANLGLKGGGLSPYKLAAVLAPHLDFPKPKKKEPINKRALLQKVIDEVKSRGLDTFHDDTPEPDWVRLRRERVIKKASKPAYAPRTDDTYKLTKEQFYHSWEWTTLRMKVLKKYGRTCMCCGAEPGNGVVINVDHIKPLSKHWELRLIEDNLQVLCHTCNKGKGAWDETDYRPSQRDSPAVMI